MLRTMTGGASFPRRRQARHTRACTLLKAPSEAVHLLAASLVGAAKHMCKEVMHEKKDVLHRNWGGSTTLTRLLGVSTSMEVADRLKLLAKGAQDVFSSQETLTDVQVPCKVFGDLHGQLRDLLLLCGSFGFPGTPAAPSVIFNGDFVDRGKHQLEVLAVLFALKIVYPKNIFLNRGNHEDECMNNAYGFKEACFGAVGGELGQGLHEAFVSAFSHMGLASLIENKILVAHGGIGDGAWTLAQLRNVVRPLRHDDFLQAGNQFIWNLLWSDPIEDDEASVRKVFGVHSSPRGKTAVTFGWNVTQAFCSRNGIDLVIRSHQAKLGGLGFDVMHNECLISVFSARDYEHHNNDGAILSLTYTGEEDGLHAGILKSGRRSLVPSPGVVLPIEVSDGRGRDLGQYSFEWTPQRASFHGQYIICGHFRAFMYGSRRHAELFVPLLLVSGSRLVPAL